MPAEPKKPDPGTAEPLTVEEETALRIAVEREDRWPATQAASLIPVLLATLDAAREQSAIVSDHGSEYGRLLAERDRLIATGVIEPDDLELPLPPPSVIETDDRDFRRDVDRWLDEGMTADQYLTFRLHLGRIRAQAAAEADLRLLIMTTARDAAVVEADRLREARRELLAKVEGLPMHDADTIDVMGRRHQPIDRAAVLRLIRGPSDE